MIVNAMIPNPHCKPFVESNSLPKRGKCQMICRIANIRLAAKADRPTIRRGRAKPLQAASSPNPMKSKMNIRVPTRSGRAGVWTALWMCAPKSRFSPAAPPVVAMGRSITSAYQPMPTRYCTIARRKSFTSDQPKNANTISAANSGPIGSSECASMSDGNHESA